MCFSIEFCSGETFQCYDGTCIPGRSVCDGNQDCRGLNIEDELSCGKNKDGPWQGVIKAVINNRYKLLK